MSINFNDPMNADAIDAIKEMFDVAGMDERTALINETQFHQQQMKKIANAAKQPACFEIHGEGEIKTLSDGTRYQVTAKGWKKIDPDPGEYPY